MKIVRDSNGNPLQQRTEEWNQFRKGKIGASMAPTIMGVNKFETKRQLWERMKGLTIEKEQTEAMKAGIEQESEALSWYMDKVGVKFLPFVVEDEIHPFLIASLDGLSDDNFQIVEVKVSQWGFSEVQKGKVPPAYYAQIQHQLMVTGLHKAAIVCYNGLIGIHMDIQRDDAYIAKMRALEIEFYESLKGDIPPDETPIRDFVDVEVDDSQLQVVTDWLIANDASKRYTATEKDLRELLIEMGDDGDFRLCKDGKPLVELVRTIRKGAIDYDRLFLDLKIDRETVERYRKKEIGYYTIKAIGE